MKKNVLYTALFALTLPLSIYGLGLGNMKVKSALDQPFLAEIELLDTQSTSMANVKASLAAPENFKKLGIAPSDVLSLLQFNIKKNEQGKYVILVHSTERMSEPYMQLVVDLTWSKGQLYKAYTVLLDPPGYDLVAGKVQNSSLRYKKFVSGHVAKSQPKAESADRMQNNSYGPTVANENVWQIAQRYKADQVILPQVVLAIVGQNPKAFSEGNLNGLKVGVRLQIPTVAEMMKVPENLATVEVMAHDKAWNDKTPINHVLPPPYTSGQATSELLGVEHFEIPPVPRMTQNMDETPQFTPQLIPATVLNPKPISNEQDIALKTEMSLTTAAVDSLRESNTVLMEQLRMMQTENKKLHGQLDQRDKEIKIIRNQLQVLQKERQALAAQASASSASDGFSSLWLVLLLLLGGSGGAAFWYFKQQEKNKASEAEKTPEPVVEDKPVVRIESLPQPEEIEPEVVEEVKDEEVPQPVEEPPQDNLMEFESGLYQHPDEKTEPQPTEESNPTEANGAALDTLLDLAKTYLGMDDKESALNTLNEVMEQGNETQKQEAQKMIAEIKKI